MLCNLCFDGPGFNPTFCFFHEFACLMTRVQRENEGGSAKPSSAEISPESLYCLESESVYLSKDLFYCLLQALGIEWS